MNNNHRHPALRSVTFPMQIAVVAGLAISGPLKAAHAQSMDYGALQQLFGEPVTASAIGTPQRARDVPANVDIVTSEDIRRSGAYDIPGVLKHVLGVDVLRWSVLGADVSVRGYASPMTPRLLVLIDGRQVYIDDWGRTEWASLPVELSEIRQIEIVKGPNSALFGFNAAGGVINIITFNPLYDRLNTATIRLGTQGYREASGVASDKIGDNVGIRLSAGGTLSNDFDSVKTIAGAMGQPHNTSRDQVSLDLHWRPDPQSDLEFQATHSENQRLALAPVWLPAYTHNQLNSLLARYITDTKIGVISATAYSNWSSTAAMANFSINPTAIPYQTQLTVAQLQDELQIGSSHTVRISTEYRHDSVNTVPDAGGTISYDIASLGAMWNWQLSSSIAFTAAGRVDALWLSRTGGGLESSPLTNADWNRQLTEPSYNIGLVWHPLEQDRLRVAVARGIQLPSLIALGGFQNLPTAFAFLSSNPAIRPTTVNNYEVDWDHDFPAWHAQSRVAVFYQTSHALQSLISPLNIGFAPTGGLIVFGGNVGNSSEVGAEFSMQGTIGTAWRWSAGYSPRIVRDDFYRGASPSTSALDFAHTTPRHVFKASLGWASGPWEVDGFLNVQSAAAGLFTRAATNFSLVPFGTVIAFDARAAYKVTPNVTLSLLGENVLFSSARQNGWSKNEQQVLGQVTAHF